MKPQRNQATPLFLIMSMHLLIMTAVTKITTTTMMIMKIAMTTIEAIIPIKVDQSLVFLIHIHS